MNNLIFPLGCALLATFGVYAFDKLMNEEQHESFGGASDDFELSGGSSPPDKSKPAIVVLKANWCGHCKAFLPIWDKFVKQHERGSPISFVTWDSKEDKDDIEKVQNMEGYPTIRFYPGGLNTISTTSYTPLKYERDEKGLNAFYDECLRKLNSSQ